MVRLRFTYLKMHIKPELVVLDLMLPDKDGWEITQIVRNDATLASTPIIMLNSSS